MQLVLNFSFCLYRGFQIEIGSLTKDKEHVLEALGRHV